MAATIITTAIQLPGRIVRFMREAIDELKKVSWPDRQTTIRYTMIVVISSIVVGLLTGGLDYLLNILFKTMVSRI